MLYSELKNKVLKSLASEIESRRQEILDANRIDVEAYNGEDASMMDRLKVGEKKIDGMLKSVLQTLSWEDPIGKVKYSYSHPDGMSIENISVPFGNILIIYESRPDVTIEAALTAFKAGNKIFLKGGKEARNSNLILVDCWHKALIENDVSKDYVQYLDYDRKATQKLIATNPLNIDLIIPRGGEGLIQYVKENTNIPVIVSGRGNNFCYIHDSADAEMAKSIIINGKSRISVCNALDKVILHQSWKEKKDQLGEVIDAVRNSGIELITDEAFLARDFHIDLIRSESVYYEEFLSSRMMLMMVGDVESAINVINKYSGGHSATIIAEHGLDVEKFLVNTDCAAVYHNASTRYTDGGQFGMGAEMAISTQKLHFRGPIAIDQLVTNKWIIRGTGQVRK
ncbi:MAG: glutamate-5-semialdehyde dehydrogenase [Saprospiraceae bacterium]|nr:glutamate-5-semialdehyde dehydrogenase [Saprospiraceae bacterium]